MEHIRLDNISVRKREVAVFASGAYDGIAPFNGCDYTEVTVYRRTEGFIAGCPLLPASVPIETDTARHPSFSDRTVQFVDAAGVWLKAPMSRDLSRWMISKKLEVRVGVEPASDHLEPAAFDSRNGTKLQEATRR